MKMSPASIGVGLRVTGHCSQGGRKYMEDFFSVAYQESDTIKELKYAFFGIYDGHGGREAAIFAKEHLMMEIIKQKMFWSDCDEDVLRAIREGYISTHYAMWREQEKWPKTATGLPSTAGTTATVAFIRNCKIYIGHVGDSGVVLGYQEDGENFWRAKPLTMDHKPECNVEKARIMNSGGKVITKSGVPRVVWNRPRIGHKGPVRRSTPIDEIPFLAVARSLGDLWSYNSANNEFVVSPDPDVKVVEIDPETFRCLIFGTDGVWNVVSPSEAVSSVRDTEVINDHLNKIRGNSEEWTNPSTSLVEKALETWSRKRMRADNTSVVTVMLDPQNLPKNHDTNLTNCSSYGVKYIQVEAEVQTKPAPLADYHYPASLAPPQSLLAEHAYSHLYDGSLNNSHQMHEIYNSPSSSTAIATANGTYSSVDGQSFVDAANCDNSSYSYYDQMPQPPPPASESLAYTSSFAESYNSLLISSLENETSSSSNESSNESGEDYQSYRYANGDHRDEQNEYQQQCMSAEEGYSLTKLETRGEQQLRTKQTFQIFGETSSVTAKASCSEFGASSDNSNSNFLINYEDETRFFDSSGDLIGKATLKDISTNSTLNIPEAVVEEIETFSSESVKMQNLDNSHNSPKSPIDEIVEATEKIPTNCFNSINGALEKTNEMSTNSPTSKNSNFEISPHILNDIEDVEMDKTIQIHEISSSGVETVAPSFPTTSDENLSTIQKSKKPSTSSSQTNTKKNFPNVPNENRVTPPTTAYDKGKSPVVKVVIDFTKRTLRSRNSLSKDMKAKSVTKPTTSLHHLRRSVVTENNTKIPLTGLNLRSRQITSVNITKNPRNNIESTLKSKQQPKIQNNSIVTATARAAVTSSHQHPTPVSCINSNLRISSKCSPSSPSSVSSSTPPAKRSSIRSSIRNSAWCSSANSKNSVQTRNRVQKRLNR